ncbi:hypothetical protein [Nocardioides alkalitolerans]|uniref:hypothetical protein n=1 Tax=Nocardioides alkalitolerans TaxID=281714 RepID=UPI0003FEBD96|nr:hypothetical protein [Nocardioides alkalitolerans]
MTVSPLHPGLPSRALLRAERLRLQGATLLTFGFLGLALVLLLSVDGYRWTDDDRVVDDGVPRVFELPAGATVYLWGDESVRAPDCVVRDAASGDDLDLRPARTGFVRQGGSAGDYRPELAFTTRDGDVEITCGAIAWSGGTNPATAHVEARPWLPAWIDNLGPAWRVLPVLGLLVAGALLLALGWGSTVRLSLRERRG